jgi:glyoxylase-like metal-dependent hydrolase (beta-lactamase superfamily II)
MVDGMGMGRAYLYQEADRLTLIDSGVAGSADRILAEVERIGRQPKDLQQIIITHWHADHAGSLHEIIDRTGAKALVHSTDASIVRGDREQPGQAGVFKLLDPVYRLVGPKLKPVSVYQELQDGDEVDLGGAARIIHTPGHTMGSVSVYVPGRKVLFTGDAAANVFGLRPTIGTFTEDGDAARASFRKLAQLEFEVACFGHGKPLDKEASLAFRKHVERWPSGEF